MVTVTGAGDLTDPVERVIQAARECVTACYLTPTGEGGRQWCCHHQEWTQCPVAVLAEALAALGDERPGVAGVGEGGRSTGRRG